MSKCSEDEGFSCRSASAVGLVSDCFMRLATGDWTRASEDILTISLIIGFFLLSWQITYYLLRVSSLWERRSRTRGGSLQTHSTSTSTGVAHGGSTANPVPDANSENQADTPSMDADQRDQAVDAGSADMADFRAGGDGWEAEDDVDYIVDEEILNRTNEFSEEDSEDEVIVLRQIILAADNETATFQQHPADVEEGQRHEVTPSEPETEPNGVVEGDGVADVVAEAAMVVNNVVQAVQQNTDTEVSMAEQLPALADTVQDDIRLTNPTASQQPIDHTVHFDEPAYPVQESNDEIPIPDRTQTENAPEESAS